MFESDRLMEYALRHSSAEDEVLAGLYRETCLKTVYPRMCAGPFQGILLEMISRMIAPSRILEIGTFTGYSAIHLAKGMTGKGKLHTIDINDETAVIALKYFVLSGLENRIIFHHGDALKIIPTLEENFDLVFIDGDKKQYLDYYHIAMKKLRKGGFILADNVLWGGKVLENPEKPDRDSQGITDFNNYLLEDLRIKKVMIPLRDGLFIIQKITG